jgi:hypothetical protein
LTVSRRLVTLRTEPGDPVGGSLSREPGVDNNQLSHR